MDHSCCSLRAVSFVSPNLDFISESLHEVEDGASTANKVALYSYPCLQLLRLHLCYFKAFIKLMPLMDANCRKELLKNFDSDFLSSFGL